jgi:hypothetical protein
MQAPDYATVKEAVGMCQIILAQQEPCIPIYEKIIITGARNSWKGYIDELGVGWNNFYSLLEAHPAAASSGGTLLVGLSNPVDSLNPVSASTASDWSVLNEIYDTLAGPDPYTLWAAQSCTTQIFNWTTAPNSPQGTEITWVLSNNLYFQDGVKLTSEDVKFTYEWLSGPTGIHAPRYSLPFHLCNVTCPDASTAIMYLNTTSYFALPLVAEYPILPEHIWSKYTTLAEAEAVKPELTGELIGSGPYSFVQYVPNANVTLQANANYFTAVPATITDLAASSVTGASVTLTWTAPGGDEMSGTATGYVLKYSTAGPINNSNWNSATTYSQSWTPLAAGGSEVHVVSGLGYNATYWFAIRAYNEASNYGGVSNSPSATIGPEDALIIIVGGVVAMAAVVLVVGVATKRRST